MRLLRCPYEGGELELADAPRGEVERVMEGALRCVRCQARFPIQAGVVRMLDEEALDAETSHERKKRDEEAESYHEFVADPAANAMEMEPMFEALSLTAESVVFEFGCGTGRYTVRLAESCRALVAVDFSGDSLRVLARKLDATSPVGLVQADVTRLRLAPRAFHRGVSTLVSNLVGASRRADMYRIAAEALRPDGIFVFGTHYFSLVQRLRRLPKEGHYGEGGIYRCYVGRREIAKEVSPYFRGASTLPVQIPVPLGVRLGLPVVRISRFLGRVPAVNQLGNLLVVAASRPTAGAAPRIVSEAPVLTAPQ